MINLCTLNDKAKEFSQWVHFNIFRLKRQYIRHSFPPPSFPPPQNQKKKKDTRETESQGAADIMEISEGVGALADKILRDLHNSLDDTKDEFNNCFIIHSK